MNKEAIVRAADWLEANPDKHIVGRLAKNADGYTCSPTHSEATFFCAMGRIAKEAHIGFPPVARGVIKRIAERVGLSKDEAKLIWMMNDNHDCVQPLGPNGAGLDVIPLLRKIAT